MLRSLRKHLWPARLATANGKGAANVATVADAKLVCLLMSGRIHGMSRANPAPTTWPVVNGATAASTIVYGTRKDSDQFMY